VLLGSARAGGGLSRIAIAPQPIRAGEVAIEPDASSAVYAAAAAVLTGGSVLLEGLPRRSAQPDAFFLDDLALRGAAIEEVERGTRVSARGTLRGLDSDYSAAPDAAVMAMVLAACASSPSRFTGLATLRVKESDRISAVAAGLRALGGTVETGEDWARIHPLPARLAPAEIDTANDHRIAMAFAVLGLARGCVSIKNPSCVAKSWPGFWDALTALCCENRPR
jgi:3-phosphoshikimate 1-carboxyvinyltransferase